MIQPKDNNSEDYKIIYSVNRSLKTNATYNRSIMKYDAIDYIINSYTLLG